MEIKLYNSVCKAHGNPKHLLSDLSISMILGYSTQDFLLDERNKHFDYIYYTRIQVLGSHG